MNLNKDNDSDVINDIADILTSIFTLLDDAANNRKSPMHTPIVASIDLDGAPNQRVMVLREFDRERNILRFHTDIRSPKVAEIGSNNNVSIAFYDAQKRVQLKLYGKAEILSDADQATEAWLQTDTMGRRVYLCDPGSGAKSNMATSGIAEELQSRRPTLEESEMGRKNFAIIIIKIDKIDWLSLSSKGNKAASFRRVNNGWDSHWLIP